jgi:hypothetical protein
MRFQCVENSEAVVLCCVLPVLLLVKHQEGTIHFLL